MKFWGTRGSIPTPGHSTRRYGGNTPCVEVRIGEHHFILDGGTGLRELGLDLLRRQQGPVHVHLLFSHMHWDHIQGFPFFVPAYNPSSVLRVYGCDSDDRHAHELLSGQMSSTYFPVEFSDLGAQILREDIEDGERWIDDIHIRVLEAQHPGGCLIYSLEHKGVKVVYATDNELDLHLDEAHVRKNPQELRILPENLVELVRGAELLIADGQYMDSEYLDKVNWGHPRATTATDLAIQAGVKQLAIFHHDPMQTDMDVAQKIDLCRVRAQRLEADNLIIFGAREGVELRLDRG